MWLGEYLCQNGVLTQDQLVKGMGEYIASRPPIGKLAIEYKMLSISEIQQILEQQADDPAPFGEIAIQKGLLVREQVEMLIGRQIYEQTLWDYLVSEDYLSQETLDGWLVKFHRLANENKAHFSDW